MPKSIHLYQLIKSLSQSEKRYFRLFCQHSGGKAQYQKLFEAISQQKEYDEKKLRKQFSDHSFIKHFHLTKRYLYDLLLKALRNYHASISAKSTIQDQLRNVEILFHKGLFDQCEVVLKWSEEKASHFQLPYLQWEIANWQRKLVQVKGPTDGKSLLQTLDSQGKALESLHKEYELRLQMLGKSIPEAPSPKEQWPLSNQTLWANFSYLRTLANNQSSKTSQKDLQQALEALAKHPHLIQEDPHLWATTLNNLLALLVWTKQYEEAAEWIKQSKSYFAQIKQTDPSFVRLILRTFNLELEIYRDTRSFAAAETSIRQIIGFLENTNNTIPISYSLSFWYQFAYLYFLQNKYKEALHWINQILNQNFEPNRQGLTQYGHWLNLMVHLELKNYFVLRYYVDSTKRWLQKMGPIKDYEKILLRFFSKTSRLAESDFPQAFKKLHQQLFDPSTPLMTEGFQQEYLPIREWIEGKVKVHH